MIQESNDDGPKLGMEKRLKRWDQHNVETDLMRAKREVKDAQVDSSGDQQWHEQSWEIKGTGEKGLGAGKEKDEE